MPFYIRIFFYSFLFAPFYAYLIHNRLELIPYYLLGSLATILFLILIIERKGKIKIPKYIYPLFLFFVYYSVWDFFNGRYEQFGILKLLFKNYPLHILCILLIIENVKFDVRIIKHFLIGFKFIIVISLVFTLFQLLVDPLFFTTEETSTFDLSSFVYQIRNTSMWGYLSPLDVGLSFVPILAILLGYFYYNKKYKLFSLFLILGAIVALFTNTRWTQLNLLVLLLPIFIGLRKSKFKAIMVTAFSVIVVTIILNDLLGYTGITPSVYVEKRLLSASAESRFLAWELFQKFFPQNPMFGTGVRVDPELGRELANRSSQIHVGYLSSLYEFGIVGSIFLFSFWFLLFKTIYNNSKIHKQKFLIFGILSFLLANLTLVEYSIFHIGILCVIFFDKFYFHKNSQISFKNIIISKSPHESIMVH